MERLVGFIGLGIMGRPMARNLCRAGIPLIVNDTNRDACTALEQNGAKYGTLREIAQTCELIMMCLPNGSVVRSVLFDPGGLGEYLSSKALICDMSSISTAEALDYAGQLKHCCGASYVDSPISGGEQKAIRGELTVMAGCSEEQFQMLRPYYQAIASAYHRVGGVGQGCLAKLCNQIIVTANITAICEAFAFAEKHHMDLPLLYEVLRIGSADSAMLESRISKIVKRDFTPGGAIKTHLKDIRNILEEAKYVGVDLPLTNLLADVLAEHTAEGNGGLDSSSLMLYYEKRFGVEAVEK